MKLVPALALALITSACNSQVHEDEYLDLVRKECPEAVISEVEREKDHIEVEYRCGDRFFEIEIKEGQIVSREEEKGKEKKKITKTGIAGDATEQNWDFSEAFAAASYNFDKPERIYEMPKELMEISGIALSGSNTFLCVQDELGIVFEYDPEQEKIKDFYKFTDDGDFEDIALIDGVLYILRSDGNIFEFDYMVKGAKAKQLVVETESIDSEGLFYQPESRSLLLANKAETLNGNKNERIILKVNPKGPSSPEVFKTIHTADLKAKLAAKPKGKKQVQVQFNPSALAIHPLTNDLYVLSADNPFLAVFSSDSLKAVYPLPPGSYFKPEGLAFYPNGDLLIASEGNKKNGHKGKILFLKYRQ